MKTASIQNSETVAIGIDLGGTKTEAILLASNGTLLWWQRRPTNGLMDTMPYTANSEAWYV